MAQKSGTCHTCRKRKLWCDSKSPSCSQCLLTGRECPGYQRELVIQQYNGRNKSVLHLTNTLPNAKPLPLARKSPRPLLTGQVSNPTHRAIKFTLLRTPFVVEDYASAIVYKFTPNHELSLQSSDGSILQSRLCGTWIRLVPNLIESSRRSSGILYAATRALAAALTENDPKYGPPHLAREFYLDAMQALRNGLMRAKSPSTVELLATSMCLSIVEVILGDFWSGFTAHADGVGELMINLGPDKFISGPCHHLFVAFQPIMVCSSLRRRKSTVLGQTDWNSIPFRLHSGNAINNIISIVSILPQLLEQLDSFCNLPSHASSISVQNLSKRFQQVLDGLSDWEDSFNANGDGPICWPSLRVQNADKTATSFQHSSAESISFGFANIFTANALNHCWAFKVIALSNLDYLNARFFGTPSSREILQQQPPETFEDSVKLCTKIYQSIDYLLQDEMKVFGPASAFFPLRVSHDFFKVAGPKYSLESAWGGRLLAKIIAKGCRISSLI